MKFAKFININGKYIFFNDESDLIKIYQEAISQLTNNWNELEEWCKNNLGYYGEEDGYVYKYMLDKMKEIKEKE